MNSGVYFYIHIPFCYRKCPYCSFVSYEKRLSTKDSYIKKLIDEIKSFKTDKMVKTIYFGGGTPSTLKPNHIESVLNAIYLNFCIDSDIEITLEANPVSLKKKYLNSLKTIGVNRLSIGVQSFVDKKLKILGRLHNSTLAETSVKSAQDAGFDNISIDLIYGLKETKQDMEFELDRACSLDIQHISAYMLSIEKNTEFEKRLKNGQLKISDDNEMTNLYIFISKYLKNRGFEHYEISNFAKNGLKSRHNCSYWLGYDYRGFGVSASSFIDGIRFKNTDSLDLYLNSKNIIETSEKLDTEIRIREDFVLLLRRKKGVNSNRFNRKYGIDIELFYKSELDKFIQLNLIKRENGHIFLNGAEAMVVSNAILSEFI
jgi:oxygen-independent coproporphyrinogen-3 oxidase